MTLKLLGIIKYNFRKIKKQFRVGGFSGSHEEIRRVSTSGVLGIEIDLGGSQVRIPE